METKWYLEQELNPVPEGQMLELLAGACVRIRPFTRAGDGLGSYSRMYRPSWLQLSMIGLKRGFQSSNFLHAR
jgi:hypothetical protein